jgi:hypothetical protein
VVRAAGCDLPDNWDRLVASSADLDRFCSASPWALSTRDAYAADAEIVAAKGPAAAVALGRTRLEDGAWLLCGLDPVWGFASAVVGPDVAGAAALAGEVLGRRRPGWDVAALTGLVPGSARYRALVRTLAGRYRLGRGQAITRCRVDLDATGAKGVVARRSATFQRTLRQAQRRAEQAGLVIELDRGGGAEVVERCREVDRSSWKGRQGVGLVEEPFFVFYTAMAARLAHAGALRSGFARLDGQDVGYILGAVLGDTYRGFQLSYDARQARLSLGNLLQYAQLEALEAEPVTSYDLGMDMPYKRRWADSAFTTETLVVMRQ